jgi:putative CocE/NonD family hydrolase
VTRSRRFLAAVLVAPVLAVGLLVVGDADPAAPAPTGFVTVSDGVKIAVNVKMPDNYVPGKRYPTIFEMSGYDGGSADGGTLAKDVGLDQVPIPGQPVPIDDSRQLSDLFTGQYVTVHASVRGTGCSSGEFDLFSWRSALDGKEIIDGWIPNQPWSNGKVGIVGHSYSGITGFMVAATQPTHLRGASVSGLIDDVYRALAYPGGVSNYGFPLLWTAGIRPAYDVAGGLLPGILREEGADDDPNRQEDCALNVLGKGRTVTNDPLLQGLDDTDNEWYRSRSLMTYADRITVPIQMAGAYQDEQTGPRGAPHLFETVTGVPKRLLLTNGDHNTQSTASYGLPEIWNDRKAWIDHWVRGLDRGFGTRAQDKSSVSVFLDTHREGDVLVSNGRKNGTTFPLADTKWTDWYLHANGTMGTTSPTGVEAGSPYVSGTGRQFWSYQAGGDVGPPVTTAAGPDELTYRSAPLATNTAVIGPMAATLFVQSTGVDTELFVEIIDEAPDGSRSYLQRGLLKASHRAIDATASDRTPDGRIYRPHRPHTNPTLITPGTPQEYLVEMWPLGHVFRAGHRIVIKIHSPPVVDSYYAYVPRNAPSVNTVLHGIASPSRVMLPMVPLTGVTLGPPLPCGALEAVRCIPPS